MRYVTYRQNGEEKAGILSEDMREVYSFSDAGLCYPTLLNYIQNHSPEDVKVLESLKGRSGTPAETVCFLAPIPHPHHDVVCLGLNYMDHVKESRSINISDGEVKREEAVYFSKRVTEAVGSGGFIESHADMMKGLDYEAELAAVIGKTAQKVAREDAWKHVFGFMCFNDVSAREVQRAHVQWYFGKSLDTFTAYGPFIASADEFTFPLELNVISRVNGEVRQHGNTRDMIFPLDYVIEELSSGMTLDAGTIIATGTPAGVGAGFSPPRFMKPGDICEIEIDGCGVLKNTVK